MMTDTQSKKIASKTVRRTNPVTYSAETKVDVQKKYLERESNIKKFQSTADKLAGDKFHYCNWYYDGGKDAFPQHDNLRYVDKMYPNAEGGLLLVDEPRFDYEIARCDMKRQVLRKLGYRYIVITPNVEFVDLAVELERQTNELDHVS